MLISEIYMTFSNKTIYRKIINKVKIGNIR